MIIATILDDVAVMTKVATQKTAGVLGDGDGVAGHGCAREPRATAVKGLI